MKPLWVVFICSLAICSFAQERESRLSAGVQYTYFRQQHTYVDRHNHMVGARVDYRFAPHVWAVAQFDVAPPYHIFPEVASNVGGRLSLWQAGVKAGVVKRKFGIFGEVRGGVSSWSGALLRIDSQEHYGRLTDPVLNVGVTAEQYVSRRWALRANVGDTIVFLRSRTVFVPFGPLSGSDEHCVQISTGVFYRF